MGCVWFSFLCVLCLCVLVLFWLCALCVIDGAMLHGQSFNVLVCVSVCVIVFVRVCVLCVKDCGMTHGVSVVVFFVCVCWAFLHESRVYVVMCCVLLSGLVGVFVLLLRVRVFLC